MKNRNLVGAILAFIALIVHLACFAGLIKAHPERLLQVDSLNLSDITRSILAGGAYQQLAISTVALSFP